jgi:aldehyde dehydrogenase (NAD+)
MINREYSSFFVDGSWQPAQSDAVFDVISPRSERRIGSVPSASTADIDVAVAAARRAFDETDWARRPASERGALCARLAEAINERADELAELITEESGCGLFLSQVYQAVAPTVSFNYYAQLAGSYRFEEVRIAEMSSLAGGASGGSVIPFAGKSLVVQEPVGVVACITAYNFALACAAQKAAPALVAGCTVVLKAPEPNPLAVFALGDLMQEVGFPPGVLNIVAAGPEASAHLIAHPDVDMVSFTGSSAVGARIGEVCGAQIKRCVLELGGKSAAIILDDADLETALPMVVALGAGTTQGENCTCMSRILAPRSQYDEIAAQLTEAFKSLKVGDPHEDDTVVGPMVTEVHRDRVLGYIKTAVEEGATVAFGGGVPEHMEQGWYVEPTLLTNVSNDSTIAQEEVFGPVIALIPYEDEEDAVRLANDSHFGLSGAVFSGSQVRGFEIARRIRTGTFRVNTMSVDFNSSFGGYKDSGLGREHGPYAIDEYLLEKTISIEPSEEVPEEVLQSLQSATAQV